MQTYVINLRRSPDRRAHIERQLAPTGLDYVVIEAVDGRELSSADWARLVDPESVRRWPRWITAGAVGCILSHLRVYEHIAQSRTDVALVLEDDGKLSSDFGRLVPQLAAQTGSDGVMLLNFRSFAPCKLSRTTAQRVGRATIYTATTPSQCISTLAYLIGRDAAAHIARTILPVRWAADSWGEYVTAGALDSVRCVLPRPVRPDLWASSTIRHDARSRKRDPFTRMVRSTHEVARLVNRLRIAQQMNRVELVP